jgi:hypothetical protein
LIQFFQNVWKQKSMTNVDLKFAIIKLFQLIVFNVKEGQYFCWYSWSSKDHIQNSFWLNFLLKWCCEILNMQSYKVFKTFFWKDIYFLQDDCINKALPFAKISPWVCWWIWIFLSFLRKFHVSDFIPFGTLCRPCFIPIVSIFRSSKFLEDPEE